MSTDAKPIDGTTHEGRTEGWKDYATWRKEVNAKLVSLETICHDCYKRKCGDGK